MWRSGSRSQVAQCGRDGDGNIDAFLRQTLVTNVTVTARTGLRCPAPFPTTTKPPLASAAAPHLCQLADSRSDHPTCLSLELLYHTTRPSKQNCSNIARSLRRQHQEAWTIGRQRFLPWESPSQSQNNRGASCGRLSAAFTGARSACLRRQAFLSSRS